jgi:tetratricopeptide (TPR) repeat protein
VADPVRTVDVAPTMLDLLGVKPASSDGTSLVPLLTGAKKELGLEAYSEALYPLHHFGWSDLRALREGRFKVIAAPRPELYDLEDDPLETTNIFASRSGLGERMLQRLDQMEGAWRSQSTGPTDQPVDIDPDAKARLAALGYVGTFVASAGTDRDRAKLADPKDKVHLFNLISHARDITKDEGSFDEVVKTLMRVVDEDRNVIDAWFMLGNVHASHGKPAQAIRYFTRALALKPDDEMAVINMANAYRALGKDEEALLGYRRFLQLDPKNPQVRYEVAQILIDRGELDGASTELGEALRQEPKMAAARNALGVIAIRRGDLVRAEQEIRGALAQKADVRLAHFNLALLAEARQDYPTAIAEYQKEIEGHPGASFKAAFNLGRLYEQLGERAAQERAYRAAIEGNPGFVEGYFYLAKFYLDGGTRLDEAERLARTGLEKGPDSEYAALGHYVLADVYSRRRMFDESRREAALGRASEASAKGRRPSRPGQS